ncbi:hypothetical protein PR048_003401 [Dryococelus australis]|uniref:SAM domain-containing protein n=1 Tax=Dryococelus australis TaxID=614101 RepID=A0ABQ9INX3_9NEOP|nr:hypothetical protein PR048_003401 [Dryococelus australis]
MEEWLRLLRLEEYASALLQQGYHTVQDVTQLTWEDLEDIGIVKLGHQKKILLAIKRVKDIQSGKRFSSLQQHVDIISQVSARCFCCGSLPYFSCHYQCFTCGGNTG